MTEHTQASKRTLTQRLHPLPSGIVVGILISAFLGFADATYLTVEHVLGQSPVCADAGCSIVTTSEYATLGPIPIAAFGAGYYVIVILIMLYAVQRSDTRVTRWLWILTGLAFLFSVRLVYLQIFVIEAICYWCMFSAGTSTLIFLLSLFIPKYLKEKSI